MKDRFLIKLEYHDYGRKKSKWDKVQIYLFIFALLYFGYGIIVGFLHYPHH